MADGPWEPAQDERPQPRPPRFALGAWLILMGLAVAAVWGLAKLFPGQLSTPQDVGDVVRGLVIVALGAAMLAGVRRDLRRSVRHLAIWLAIVAVLALGYSFRGELGGLAGRVRSEFVPGYAVATAPREMVVAQDAGGHFVLYGQVNGQAVRFLVDTGASEIVLSPADARRIGVDVDALSYTRAAETANGVGLSAPFTARTLVVGGVRLSDVEMEVNQAPMSMSLLGMTFFRRLDSFRMEGGRLYLRWRE